MIWELSQDDGEYNLLKTVSSGLAISTEQPNPEPEEPEDGDSTEETDGNEPEEGTDDADDTEPEEGTDDADDTEPEEGTDDIDDTETEDETDDTGDKDKEDGSKGSEDKDTENDNRVEGEAGKGTNGSEESNQKLPATATNMFNILAVGTIIILIGIGTYYFQSKRRKVK